MTVTQKAFALMSELREALKEVTQSSLSGKFAHSAILLSGRGQRGTTTGVSHTVQFELPVCALILNRLLMNAEVWRKMCSVGRQPNCFPSRSDIVNLYNLFNTSATLCSFIFVCLFVCLLIIL